MATRRIVLDLSTEAADMLDRHAAEDNCTPSAVVAHLVTGRALVKDGHMTVPELVESTPPLACGCEPPQVYCIAHYPRPQAIPIGCPPAVRLSAEQAAHLLGSTKS
jgi:hypothetical protein